MNSSTTDFLATSPSWTAESDIATQHFGWSVATAGDVNGDGFVDVIVGAPYSGGGRAYVYLGAASGLSPTPGWMAQSDLPFGNFGYSVATAGDVNADGFADVIVGAPYSSNGESREGRAYLYLGSASGLSATPNWTGEGNLRDANFGFSVGTAGDVNGDGFADVIVGAPTTTYGSYGRSYVYYGAGSGLSPTPTWTAEGGQGNGYFGFSVGTAGDVTGDGFGDVIVGEPGTWSFKGRAHVYHGSAGGLSSMPNWTAEGDQDFAAVGHSVATAGDVNGDGFADVIVGAPGHNPQGGAERAYVYFGAASGLSATPSWTAETEQADVEFGYSVGGRET